jgi:hypothetical protein
VAQPDFEAGVNSYASDAYAEGYFDGRGRVDDWLSSDYSDEARHGALIAATEYLDAHFRWRGYIEDAADQTLGWPRYSAMDHEGRLIAIDHPLVDASDGIPYAVKNATCEMAIAHLSVESLTEAKQRGGDVKLVRVGPITQEFFESSPQGMTFPHLRRMLVGLYSGHPAITSFIRK